MVMSRFGAAGLNGQQGFGGDQSLLAAACRRPGFGADGRAAPVQDRWRPWGGWSTSSGAMRLGPSGTTALVAPELASASVRQFRARE
jgi:hypothetical protein